MSTVREARPRHQSLLPRGSVGRSPSEMQQRGGERTHGGSEDVQKSRQKWKENRISLAELPVIASWRQKPSAKFDISILKYWDIIIILTAQIATLVIGSQRSTEPRCPCGLDDPAWLRRKVASLWRRENDPLRGNDDAPFVGSYPENMCQDCTSHHSGHLTPHVDTHLGRNILSSFVRRLVRFLTFLNNSAPARIARSYSVLNMPKRATDKGQEARLQLALLLHTIGRQIHFVTMHAALWAFNFVPGPFLSFPSRPSLPHHHHLSGLFVSLMLLTSGPAPFLRSASSLHPEPRVSGAFVLFVCARSRRSCYLGSSEGSPLFFMAAKTPLTNWMRCKSNRQRRRWTAGDAHTHTHTHTAVCYECKTKNLHLTHVHRCHSYACVPLCLWRFITASSSLVPACWATCRPLALSITK